MSVGKIVRSTFNHATLSREVSLGIGRGIDMALREIEYDLKRRTFRAPRAASGLFRGGGVGGLAVGTGAARASIQSHTYSTWPRGKHVGVIGSPLPYVAAHEYGATIKGRPWLKIPTIYAHRYGFTGVGPQRETFTQRTRRGSLFVFASIGKGKRAKAVPIYLLVRKVTLPERRMFEQSAQATEKKQRDAIAEGLLMGIERAARGSR